VGAASDKAVIEDRRSLSSRPVRLRRSWLAALVWLVTLVPQSVCLCSFFHDETPAPAAAGTAAEPDCCCDDHDDQSLPPADRSERPLFDFAAPEIAVATCDEPEPTAPGSPATGPPRPPARLADLRTTHLLR
jgi:hypothetical protein